MGDVKFMEPEEYEAYLAQKKAEEEAFVTGMCTEEEAKNPPELGKITSTEDKEIQVSLYDLNRQMISQMPDMTEEQLLFARESFKDWLNHYKDNYYMLLNHELHYFTLFHGKFMDEETYNNLWQELLEVFQSVGHLKMVELDNNDAMAFWSTWDNGEDELPYCFYFFPYGQGVVEV